MNIKKGDKVLVIAGKDRGKTGLVVAADHIQGLIKVEGVGVYKRHLRRRGTRQAGGATEIIAPIPASKVMLLDPQSGKPTRVGRKLVDGRKIRIAKVSGSLIEDVKK